MSADFPFEDEVYPSYVNLSKTTNDDNRFEEIIYRGLAPTSLQLPPPPSFWSSFESADLAPVNNKPLLHKTEPGVLAELEPIGETNVRQDVIDEEWELEDTVKGPFSSELSLEPVVWLESSSFNCGTRAPHTVLNRVCAHLTATHVPFSIDTKQASVEGRLESGAGCSGFALRAFRGDCGNAVFELQRRHGCVLLFTDLFQRILSWLGSAVKPQLALPWETSDPMLPLELGDIPPPLSLHSPQPPLDLTLGDTTSLFSMLDSEQHDVQLEGLRVLATVAKESTQSATVVCDMLAARTKDWELMPSPQQDNFHKACGLSYELMRWKKTVASTVQEQDLNPGAEN